MILRPILFSLLLIAAPASAQATGPAPVVEKPDSNQVTELIFVLACLQALTSNDTAGAQASCTQALALNPRDPDAYKLRGYAYLVDHSYRLAESDFRAGLALRPKDHEMVAGLGQSLSGQGRYGQSIPRLSQAVRLAPRNAAYWNALCWARAGDGHALGQALKDCNHALALAPGAASALNSRGLVQLKSHRYQAAIADYEASLKARPAQSSARFGRGLARLWLADRVGVADILMARESDNGIDDLFVLIGALPADCARPAAASCPPGFPARGQAPPEDHFQAVSLVFGDGQDLFLAVEVGRLDLMVDQMALLLDRPALTHHDEAAPQTPAESVARLEATTARFNTLLPAACYCARIPQKFCAPYHPPHAGTSLHAALAAADGLFRRIRPVWQAVCRGHESQCQLE